MIIDFELLLNSIIQPICVLTQPSQARQQDIQQDRQQDLQGAWEIEVLYKNKAFASCESIVKHIQEHSDIFFKSIQQVNEKCPSYIIKNLTFGNKIYDIICSIFDSNKIILHFNELTQVTQVSSIQSVSSQNDFLHTNDNAIDFLENSPRPFHAISDKGVILWANKCELNTLGYQADEYIGHHVTEVSLLIHSFIHIHSLIY